MATVDMDRFREALDAMNELDPARVAEYVHPDVEWTPLRAGTEGTYRGVAGLQRFVQDTREVFEDWRLETHELREVSDGCVLVLGTLHVRTRPGLDVKQPVAALNWLRDGLLVRHLAFASEDEALAALDPRQA